MNSNKKETKEYKGEEIEEEHIPEWTSYIKLFEGFGVLVMGENMIYSNSAFVNKMREFEERRYVELGIKKQEVLVIKNISGGNKNE